MNGKEALEEIKNRMVQNCDYADYHNEFDVVEQDLEVLKIIEKKLVNVNLVFTSENYEYYLQSDCRVLDKLDVVCEVLTETEFNLIKEWLER